MLLRIRYFGICKLSVISATQFWTEKNEKQAGPTALYGTTESDTLEPLLTPRGPSETCTVVGSKKMCRIV